MRKAFFAFAAALVAFSASAGKGDGFNVLDFGAIGDGETMNTAAIQKAIDAASAAGGGRVVIAGGRFMSGTITLKSRVDLHIAEDGVLLGSPRCEDYPERENLKHVVSENLPRERNACFIWAEEAEKIAITGQGVIDCNGQHFVEKKTGDWYAWEYQRIPGLKTPPRVVFLAGCRDVTVRDVTMINQPAGWGFWINDCDDVSFAGVKIRARVEYPNNDGIHINCSRDVSVERCEIECGDDAIVVRANSRGLKQNRPCERVSVTNCKLRSFANCIRIGWTCDGVIRDCSFSKLDMYESCGGISLYLPPVETADHGREYTHVEKMVFTDIKMDKIYAHPLLFVVENHPEVDYDVAKNFRFERIDATALELPRFEGQSQDKPFADFVFRDCVFRRADDRDPGWKDYRRQGAAYWYRKQEGFPFRHTTNFVFENTRFDVK